MEKLVFQVHLVRRWSSQLPFDLNEDIGVMEHFCLLKTKQDITDIISHMKFWVQTFEEISYFLQEILVELYAIFNEC